MCIKETSKTNDCLFSHALKQLYLANNYKVGQSDLNKFY